MCFSCAGDNFKIALHISIIITTAVSKGIYINLYDERNNILYTNVADFRWQSVFPLNATTTPISRDKLNLSNSANEKVFHNILVTISRATCNKIFEDLFKVFTISLHNKIFEDLQESDKVTTPATSACRNQWKKSSTGKKIATAFPFPLPWTRSISR